MLMKSIWDSWVLFSFLPFFFLFSSVILLHFCLLPQQLLFYTWVMKWIERTIEYSDSVPFGYVRL